MGSLNQGEKLFSRRLILLNSKLPMIQQSYLFQSWIPPKSWTCLITQYTNPCLILFEKFKSPSHCLHLASKSWLNNAKAIRVTQCEKVCWVWKKMPSLKIKSNIFYVTLVKFGYFYAQERRLINGKTGSAKYKIWKKLQRCLFHLARATQPATEGSKLSPF